MQDIRGAFLIVFSHLTRHNHSYLARHFTQPLIFLKIPYTLQKFHRKRSLCNPLVYSPLQGFVFSLAKEKTFTTEKTNNR